MGRQYVSRAERAKLQRIYALDLGTTTFNSRSRMKTNFKKTKKGREELYTFPVYTNYRESDLITILGNDSAEKTKL